MPYRPRCDLYRVSSLQLPRFNRLQSVVGFDPILEKPEPVVELHGSCETAASLTTVIYACQRAATVNPDLWHQYVGFPPRSCGDPRAAAFTAPSP